MAKKPTRDQFPKGLIGNRRYQLALEAYNRGIQPPKPKPTNNGSRPNTNPTAAEVRGRANGTTQTDKTKLTSKEMPENLKVKPNTRWISNTGKITERYQPNYYGPGGSSKGTGQGQAQQNPLSPEQRAKIKPKPAEIKLDKPPVRGSEQSTTTTRQPDSKPKSESKPTVKPSESYRDEGKGLYQGSKEYRDKVGGSGNPLLNRFRRDMGRDAKTGERQYSTPDEKSKYVDKNGKLKIQGTPTAAGTKPVNKPNPPTNKTGGNTPLAASKPMEGGTPFNTRNRFETPEQRRRRKELESRA